MACEGCEKTVEEALKSLSGVEAVLIDRDTDSVTIEGEPNMSDVKRAVTDAGYDVVQN